MKSTLSLALIMLFATAAKAETVTIKGDAVINALNSNIKNMSLVQNGLHVDDMTSQGIADMINSQLKNSGTKTRAVCIQRAKEDAQDCRIMMLVTPADATAKTKPSLIVYKFAMAKGKVSSDLMVDQQKAK